MEFYDCLRTRTAPLDDLTKLAKSYGMARIIIAEDPLSPMADPLRFTTGWYKIKCDFPTDSTIFTIESKTSITEFLHMLKKVSDDYYIHGTLDLDSKSITVSRTIHPTLSDFNIDYSKSIGKDIDIANVFTKLFAFSKTSWEVYLKNPKTIVIESERGKFKFDVDRFIDMLISLNIFEAME